MCSVELGQLQRRAAEFEEAGVEVIPVSADRPEESEKLRKKLSSRFRYLCDVDARAAETLGLLHVKGHPSEKRDIATPAMILVDERGIVRWVFKPRNYRVRADLDNVLDLVRSLKIAHRVPPEDEELEKPEDGYGRLEEGVWPQAGHQEKQRRGAKQEDVPIAEEHEQQQPEKERLQPKEELGKEEEEPQSRARKPGKAEEERLRLEPGKRGGR
ncbi:MAG: peroxiredoxin family protein, partial [Nitrospinota bacterium]